MIKKNKENPYNSKKEEIDHKINKSTGINKTYNKLLIFFI